LPQLPKSHSIAHHVRKATRSHEKVSRWDRPKPPHDWRWVVDMIGRTLIGLGLMMFAFVAYQLWGTGIQTAQAQRSLSRDFEQQLAKSPPVTTTTVPAHHQPSHHRARADDFGRACNDHHHHTGAAGGPADPR
jgi:hypothetical protein